MLTRQIASWKKEIYSDLVELLQKYPVVAVADLRKVRSSQIQEIRKKLRGKAELIVAKNTILRKASEKLATEKTNVDKFADSLTGSQVLIFSQMNPYELIIFLNKNKVRVPAKGGDIATSEIMVQGGNTGLQPGPVISEFNEAKVQTRIEGGSIFIAVTGAIVTNRSLFHQARLQESMQPGSPAFVNQVNALTPYFGGSGKGPGPRFMAEAFIYQQLNQQAAAQAYQDIYRLLCWMAIGMIACAFILSKNKPGQGVPKGEAMH